MLTKNLENIIDSFHRKILRIACLNVRWPKIVTNEEVYEITKQKAWSQVIVKREFSWLGHLFRLDENTPAKLALKCALKSTRKPRGRQKITWITMMKEKLKQIEMTWEDASRLATDRSAWNNLMEQFNI